MKKHPQQLILLLFLFITVSLFPLVQNSNAEKYIDTFELNITYELTKSNMVHLNLFNQMGELVSSPLSSIPHKAGKYTISLSSNGLANGIYWLQLLTEDEKLIEKVMLIK